MKQVNIRRLAALVPASMLALAITFTIGFSSVSAYDCETYGAGTYSGGDAGTGEVCPVSGGGTPTTPVTPSTPTTTQNSSSAPSGSSSGGSNSTTTPPLAQNPVEGSQFITLDDYAAYLDGTGQQVSMKVTDKVYFTVKSEGHSATLKEITAEHIIITVASTPVDVTIPFGESVNYDVNKDGTDDIRMTYKDIAADGLSSLVVFGALGASNTAAPVATESNDVKEQKNDVWLIIAGVVIVAIVIGLIIRKNVSSKTPTV